jgi:hypothetical protein
LNLKARKEDNFKRVAVFEKTYGTIRGVKASKEKIPRTDPR